MIPTRDARAPGARDVLALASVGAIALLLATAARPAMAGGPLIYSTTGAPVGWSTASPIPYETDEGPLGTKSNADAIDLVNLYFFLWQVPTSNLTFHRTGSIGVDVNASNFGPYLGPYGGRTTPLGANVVVFDADGSIFDALFGVGTGVVGFAGPTFVSDGSTTVPIGNPVPAGTKIIEAMAFFNGRFIDGVNDPANGNYELSEGQYEGVVAHELGHFAGLDHTQIHGINGPPDSDVYRTMPVETMFPFVLQGVAQNSLQRDDVVAISTLYPTASFLSSTGTVQGTVRDATGAPLSGIDVVVRNVDNDADAISCVSGATRNPEGQYVVHGLTPGAHYRIDIQEIDVFSQGGSSVGPFSHPVTLPGPSESFNGPNESADPGVDDPSAFTPVTAVVGGVLSGLDARVNRQPFSVDNDGVPAVALQNVAGADFDGDGHQDLVSTQWVIPNHVLFHHGIGNGQYGSTVVQDFPGAEFVAAGQFNVGVDAFPDFAAGSSTLNEIRVYLGNGNGGFTPTTVLEGPRYPWQLIGLVRANLNGDAYLDLVAILTNTGSGACTVYGLLGSATGAFTVVTTSLGTGLINSLVAGRFTGTPYDDVVGIHAQFGARDLGVLVSDGAGHFSLQLSSLASITGEVGVLASGDFDHDGVLDLAMTDQAPAGGPTNWTRSFVDVLHGDGSGGFSLIDRYQVPEPTQSAIVTADFDHDGNLDVASTGAGYAQGFPGARATIGFLDGAGHVKSIETISGLTEFPQNLAVTDANGDGWMDLVILKGIAYGLNESNPCSVLLNGHKSLVAVSGPGAPVAGPQLDLPWPHPVSTRASIRYAVPRTDRAPLELLDLQGRVTATLLDGPVSAGWHTMSWPVRDGSGASKPGVYFLRLECSQGALTRRVVLL